MTDPSATPPLPNFLIIGAQKSATRWLRRNLGTHPEIFTAPQEVKFFNHPRRVEELGLDWYREQFVGWQGEKIVGEATPGYMMWWHRPVEVAERIHRLLGDVKLIALLRDPVDRARSALGHHIGQERIHPSTDLLDWVRRRPPDQDWLGVVSGGWYAASLEPFVRLFGERLLVILYDDVVADPQAAYLRALSHVGATEEQVPESLGTVVGRTRSSPTADSDLTASERSAVFDLFAADVERLEQMLGRDLSIWRPSVATGHRGDSVPDVPPGLQR